MENLPDTLDYQQLMSLSKEVAGVRLIHDCRCANCFNSCNGFSCSIRNKFYLIVQCGRCFNNWASGEHSKDIGTGFHTFVQREFETKHFNLYRQYGGKYAAYQSAQESKKSDAKALRDEERRASVLRLGEQKEIREEKETEKVQEILTEPDQNLFQHRADESLWSWVVSFIKKFKLIRRENGKEKEERSNEGS